MRTLCHLLWQSIPYKRDALSLLFCWGCSIIYNIERGCASCRTDHQTPHTPRIRAILCLLSWGPSHSLQPCHRPCPRHRCHCRTVPCRYSQGTDSYSCRWWTLCWTAEVCDLGGWPADRCLTCYNTGASLPPSLHLTPRILMALIRYQVRYQVPYGDCQWFSQWFSTLAEAERMIAFYISCGSPAHLVPWFDAMGTGVPLKTSSKLYPSFLNYEFWTCCCSVESCLRW